MGNWTAVAVGSALLLSGCAAGFSRMTEYGSELADAKTEVDGRGFSLYVHPREDTLLVQRSAGAAIGQSFASGLSMGAVGAGEPKPYYRRAAEWLATPVGCSVTDVYPLDQGITWEAPFACPAGVDLRSLVAAHRETLRRGEPLPR